MTHIPFWEEFVNLYSLRRKTFISQYSRFIILMQDHLYASFFSGILLQEVCGFSALLFLLFLMPQLIDSRPCFLQFFARLSHMQGSICPLQLGRLKEIIPVLLLLASILIFSGLRLCSKSVVAVDLRRHCVCTES